ncbi:V-type ATPase 116kDa subunit family protein [Lebetimonas sp. JH292]|uniref:V-type ATPase 116kDa subunit family protein n=1 Tax=Lebetimonas sp. JH292 TaxID=990068 RepID=UPI0012EBC3AA|nr:V-type ATPase 116kDa subunit family protein [Lebetimonas sp. JH292]
MSKKTPTLLNTPKIFKPFELLVKNYSLPKPYEINPTVAFAIVFLFLFGLMFGDMGQGLILAILGYVLSKKSLFGNILF